MVIKFVGVSYAGIVCKKAGGSSIMTGAVLNGGRNDARATRR